MQETLLEIQKFKKLSGVACPRTAQIFMFYLYFYIYRKINAVVCQLLLLFAAENDGNVILDF